MRMSGFYRLFIVFTFFTGFHFAKAQQEPQFTQFMYSGLLYNPASAGVSGGLRGAVLGRWQWVGFEGAPNTQAFMIDSDIPDKNFGVGLSFMRDEVAITSATNVTFNYAYYVPVWQGRLSMGVSGGINRLAIAYDEAYVLDDDESFAERAVSTRPNFGVGFYYENSKMWAGISAPTILTSDYKSDGAVFYEQKHHLFLAGGYRFHVNPQVRLDPNVLLKVVAGGVVGADFNVMAWYNEFVAAGLSYRPRESVDLLLNFKASEALTIGYSFDYVTNNELSSLSSNSHELLLSYTIRHKQARVVDTDGDGIEDDLDKCPELAGTAEYEGCLPADSDGDGIIDERDDCPTAFGRALNGGCPDSDGDGVRDSEDECPNVRGLRSRNGCPDLDGDGVPDKDDHCPDERGTIEKNGCPTVSKAAQAVLDEAVIGVQFESGSDRLVSASFPVLDKVFRMMLLNPEYKLELAGYTDNLGDDQHNLLLSTARAMQVKKYLVRSGIASERIDAQGYGEANPVADNSTEAGRAKNRRVEFKIVE